MLPCSRSEAQTSPSEPSDVFSRGPADGPGKSGRLTNPRDRPDPTIAYSATVVVFRSGYYQARNAKSSLILQHNLDLAGFSRPRASRRLQTGGGGSQAFVQPSP